MASLWKRLGEVLGASFLNQFGAAEEDAYHTWSAGLADLSPEQIKSGFANYMRSDDRFLDLKRFRSMCLNLKAYGLPEAEAAYREAAGHCHEWKTWSFSHVAVSKALVETGIAVMRQCTESQSKPVFLRNYQIVCRRVMAGETIESPIPKAIPDHIPKLCTREQNIDHLAALRAATGL